MEKFRNEDGFIVLDDLVTLSNSLDMRISTFSYDDKTYYAKNVKPARMYNELIGYEIAKQVGVNSIEYDLAEYDGFIKVFSEDFNSKGKFIYMSQILTNVFGLEKCDLANNLEDIWIALSKTFKVDVIVEKLMNQVVDLYLFDILIGNTDRHNDNYGFIINNDDINLLAFDNSLLGDPYAVLLNRYAINVDPEREYSLDDFLATSDYSYTSRLLQMIESIDISLVYENILKRTNGNVDANILNRVLNAVNYNIGLVKDKALVSFNKKLKK